MGAQPSTVLVLAVVPHATEKHQEEELFQMLAGAAGVLGRAGCHLSGGHSSEGAESAMGKPAHRSCYQIDIKNASELQTANERAHASSMTI